jgi:sulfite reductase (NADPH) hemoprotein beta-component
VARIAYHCSDIVYSVQPNLTNSGPFSPTLNHLYSTKIPSALTGQITQVRAFGVVYSCLKVVPVRYNADPFLAPLRSVRLGQVASVITAAESLLLAIPHLSVLSSYAVVIHVMLPSGPFADFSTISALRQTGFAMVQSTTLQQVQDMALIAHCIAISSGKGVIHFTEAAQNDSPIATENLSVIQSLLQSQKPAPKKSYQSSPKTIYRRDLEQETASEGTAELSHTNGANGANSSNGGSPQNEVTNGHTSSTNGIAVNGNEVAVSPVSSTSSGHDDHDSDTNHFSCRISEKLFSLLYNLTGREYHNFEYYGPSSAHSAIVLFGSYTEEMKKALAQAQPSDAYSGMGLVLIRVYRPWQGTAFLTSLATDLRRIAVVEQLRHRPTKWGPVFMDVLASVRERDAGSVAVVSYQLGHIHQGSVNSALTQIATNLLLDNPQQNIAIGQPLIAPTNNKLEQPHIENSYIKMLRQLFADKLSVINSADVTSPVVATEISSSPEYLFGFYVSRSETKKRLVSEISAAARAGQLGKGNLTESILHWIDQSASGLSLSEPALQELLDALRQQGSSIAKEVVANPWIFKSEVPWIIGSEAWAYDLGTSAVHHALSSGSNINLLIIDSQPFSQKNESAAESRKKDIGLYAMNFGNAYVASVALYSSYTQVMHAMVEAQKFNGPSIVLAYLPYTSETDSPLQVLQDTKVAVDSGYWPLYRWTPASAQGAEPIFQLDSERVKKELKAFIDRENHLTHLVRGNVDLSPAVSHSHGSELKRLRKSKAKQAMDRLMDGLSGPPVSILFGSDGGNAENLAKRLGRRCKARGLKPKTLAMDDFPVEELPNEGNVIFLTSTAGQGEFPQNGRETWDALKNSTDIDLSRVRYTVFALGDSHYWPRKEDKLYYNKPGKDLDARLEALGAKKLVPIGLGDDQDPDGYETGYSAWEPQLWKAFGVDKIDVDFEEPKPLTNEDIKIASNFLRGTIAEGLADTSTGAISESDSQLTKFHGIYMQDDRDLREERKSQGLEPAYSFMVRVRMSGGVCQPEQWIAMDEISDKWGNETFKLVSFPDNKLKTH